MNKQFPMIFLVAFLAVIMVFCEASPATANSNEIVIAFEKKEYSVLAGKEIAIAPVVQGTSAKGKFDYESEDPSIATVSNGIVKGLAVGDTMIRCSVKIDTDVFQCSYQLHVVQPVEEIVVPSEKILAPSNSKLRDSVITVLPENAFDKSIEIKTTNPRVAGPSSDGKTIYIGNSPGSATITCKAKDGSGVKASFKIEVAKGAWFSVGNKIEIDSPDGITFFYVPTRNWNKNVLIHTLSALPDEKVIDAEEIESVQWDFIRFQADKPYEVDVYRSMSAPGEVRLIPLKAGKGKYVVNSDGVKGVLNVTVLRSAVYESIKYDQFGKKEKAHKGLRFLTKGKIIAIANRTIYYVDINDDMKQMASYIPEEFDPSQLEVGASIAVKGIFEGMTDYVTETGLTKKIPLFTAENIDSESD